MLPRRSSSLMTKLNYRYVIALLALIAIFGAIMFDVRIHDVLLRQFGLSQVSCPPTIECPIQLENIALKQETLLRRESVQYDDGQKLIDMAMKDVLREI